eukprot:3514078-Pyramimonas_sp.AAC.1
MGGLKGWGPCDAAMELWGDLCALHPDALVVYAHLLLGCKGAGSSGLDVGPAAGLPPEVEGSRSCWRRPLDRRGRRCRGSDVRAPTSLEAARSVCWWATTSPVRAIP